VRKVWKKGWRGHAASHATSDIVKSGKSGKSTAKKRKVKNDDEEDNDSTVKSVQFQGKAPLDSLCIAKQGKAHVYFDQVDVWDAMLNQVILSYTQLFPPLLMSHITVSWFFLVLIVD
jgi:hypothetical protein